MLIIHGMYYVLGKHLVLVVIKQSLQSRHNERDGVSEITSLTVVHPILYSGADQRKHQSSASLAVVRGIHRWLFTIV